MMLRKFVFAVIGLCIYMLIPVVPAFSDSTLSEGEVFELGEVLVTAKGGKVNLATTVTEITEQDILNQGAQTVADALEFAPGVDVQVGGKGQSHLKVRGFGQDDVKVLIDGVPAQESYFGSLDLSQIPVDAIAKIEIIKGASSVLYGPNTMGGVINIITKKGGKEALTQMTTSFGTNNDKNLILSHGNSAGKFNYRFSYGYRSAEDYELSDDFDPNNPWTGIESGFKEDGDERDLSDYIKRTINAKIGFEPDARTKIYLSFDYHNNERGCPVEYYRYWAFSKWEQWHLNLVGEHNFNDFITVKARAYYVDH